MILQRESLEWRQNLGIPDIRTVRNNSEFGMMGKRVTRYMSEWYERVNLATYRREGLPLGSRTTEKTHPGTPGRAQVPLVECQDLLLTFYRPKIIMS